jgi:hypothetical protein
MSIPAQESISSGLNNVVALRASSMRSCRPAVFAAPQNSKRIVGALSWATGFVLGRCVDCDQSFSPGKFEFFGDDGAMTEMVWLTEAVAH